MQEFHYSSIINNGIEIIRPGSRQRKDKRFSLRDPKIKEQEIVTLKYQGVRYKCIEYRPEAVYSKLPLIRRL